ncbi:MAG: Flagellum site-determining protein YlxH [Syntrophorhabdus sp. PtaU1.Bin002]|nr:MAG: Flagellum site-determining protein YlxH [Syntrophorhabdus sp. PtaU1.Bin002]
MSTREQDDQRNPLLEKVAMMETLKQIDNVLIVVSGKGGVGKSTVATNLALSLSLKGFKTGILDVDIHGPSVPKLLNLNNKIPEVKNKEITPIIYPPDLKVMSMGFLLQGTNQAVIWRGPLKYNMIKDFIAHVKWGKLDYLVVDCPPGTGDEPLSVAQLLKEKAHAVIVTTPQHVATIDVAKCITFCRHLDLPMAGIIENMSGFVCPHCGQTVDIFSRGGGKILADEYNVPFLGSIPLDPDIAKSGDEERPYVHYYPQTATAKVFEEIVAKIAEIRVEGQKDPVAETTTASNGSGKIAVPTTDGKLCTHFGHCEAFAIFETSDSGAILSETYVDPPPHEPGLLPEWLSSQGVSCVLAGGMGSRAKELFTEKGVHVVTGTQGENPRNIVEDYLKGALETGANTCDH